MAQWEDSNLSQWIDSEETQWLPYAEPEYGDSQLNQIWTDANYVYAVTTSGLNIIDIVSESLYSYAGYTTGYTAVWANNTQVFLGTLDVGIRTISKSDITGSIASPHDISSRIDDYLNDNYLTSNYIKHIHGYDNVFVCCTDLGVDVVKLEVLGYVNSTTTSGARKCFMTSGQSFYYTTVSGSVHQVNRVDGYRSDWTTPNIFYETGGGFLPAEQEINDIFVTTNTSSITGNNTLFVATTSGAYIYDEGTSVDISPTSLAGYSYNVAAIWASPDAGLSVGTLYTATTGSGAAISVVNMEDQALIDSYTKQDRGITDDTLDSDDIEDFNVVLGE